MELSSPLEKLRYMINDGIAVDAYLARQSHALLITIGHYGPMHENQKYTRFLRTMQGILADHFIVHATKLFEQTSRNHPNISIPAVLDLIESNRETFEPIQIGYATENLATLGFPWDARSLSAPDFTGKIVSFFRSTLPNIEGNQALKALKTLRDKRIVHRDATDISDIPEATYEESIKLITFAEDFMCVIGPAFIDMVYGTAGEYHFLADDARRPARSLESLFGILDGGHRHLGA